MAKNYAKFWRAGSISSKVNALQEDMAFILENPHYIYIYIYVTDTSKKHTQRHISVCEIFVAYYIVSRTDDLVSGRNKRRTNDPSCKCNTNLPNLT